MNINKKTIGFLFLGMACVIWIITPFIGFFNLSNTQLAIYLPLLIVAGEVAFLIAITLLGKEYWLKVKVFLRRNGVILRNILNDNSTNKFFIKTFKHDEKAIKTKS